MRESHAQNQIPEKGADAVPYFDQREAAQGLLKHATEAFIGQVTGADGAGGDLENVPFEPALIEVINEGGGTPTWTKFVNLGSGGIGLEVAASAADATADFPTLTRVGEGDWTVTLATGTAPDDETVTVVCYGVRDVAGGL